MKIDTETRDWLLGADPARPDIGGVNKRHREERLKLLEAIDESEVERLLADLLLLRALGGPGSGNFGHSGRPGQVGGSAPGGAAVVGAIPQNIRDEANVDVSIFPPREADEKIKEYMLRHYEVDLDGQARSMTDTDKGVAIASTDPKAALESVAQALQQRIESPEWKRITDDRSQAQRNEDFVNAFAAIVMSEPMQQLMSASNPLEVAVMGSEKLFHAAEEVFHTWGWV